MQPQVTDPLAIGRRQLDLEDYLMIARRNLGWLIGPAFFGLVASVVVAYLWPDTYSSTAIMRVIPQQVPKNFVEATITQTLSDRITSMQTTILSRQSLTEIVRAHGLYPKEVANEGMEDTVEKMRNTAIKISGVSEQGGVNRFSITFLYGDRRKCKRVVEELTSRFMNENQRDLTRQQSGMQDFVDQQWNRAKEQLDLAEKNLTSYKLAHQGQLPDQANSVLGGVSAAQARMGVINSEMSRAGQDKLLLEQRMANVRAARAALQPETQETTSAAQRNLELDRVNIEVERQQALIESLLQQNTEKHPDVVGARARLASLAAKRDEIVKNASNAPPTTSRRVIITPEFLARQRELDAEIATLQTQIRVKDLDLQNLTKQLRDVDAQIGSAQAKIASMPLAEQEYADLIQKVAVATKQFQDAEGRKNASLKAIDLVKRDLAERLEVLDPATTPTNPIWPRREAFILVGVLLGVGLGVGIIAFRELRDNTLQSLKDVRAYTQLGVLGSIPLIEDELTIRRRRRMQWFAWSTACLAGLIVMTGSALFYYTTRT